MEPDILGKLEGSLQNEKFAMDSWGNPLVAFFSYQKTAEELLYFDSHLWVCGIRDCLSQCISSR